jgi:hypothetical protein
LRISIQIYSRLGALPEGVVRRGAEGEGRHGLGITVAAGNAASLNLYWSAHSSGAESCLVADLWASYVSALNLAPLVGLGLRTTTTNCEFWGYGSSKVVEVETPLKGTSRTLRTSMSLGSGVEPYGTITAL